MTVAQVAEKLGLNVLCGDSGMDREVTGGYVSDLLSDVMGRADTGQIWVTLQTHKNVMAIASLKDLAAVILVAGNQPEADTAQQSQEEGIPVLGTSLSTFEISGKLYELLNQ
ncbi:MAG: DRTGG domain-containing protein [Bacteroidales bacterium]